MTLLNDALWQMVRHMDLKTRVIYHGDRPYLARFYLHDERAEPGKPALYLHYFFKDDPDRGLHNHPWEHARTYVLAGGYREFFRTSGSDEIQERVAKPGSYNQLTQAHFHRVELLDGRCWTLFMPGPRVSSWGFWDPKTGGEVDWKDFLKGEQANPEKYLRSGDRELRKIRDHAAQLWDREHGR